MPKIKKEEQKIEEPKALVIKEPTAIVELAAPIDIVVKQVDLFQELKKKLLRPMDYQVIQGKKFIKKAGWRKFALAFNLSDEILKEERREGNDKTDRVGGGVWFVWDVTIKATAPNGRYSVATASCDSRERKFSHQEHDVRATAATRAKNRAISDLIGGGEVSAEEMGYESQYPTNANEVRQEMGTQEGISEPQKKLILSLAKSAGFTPEAFDVKLKNTYGVDGINNLSKKAASNLIEGLKKKYPPGVTAKEEVDYGDSKTDEDIQAAFDQLQ